MAIRAAPAAFPPERPASDLRRHRALERKVLWLAVWMITAIDAHPATLSWLASVQRQKVIPLGVDRFGQSGDLPDLYREYRLDVDAIVDAAAHVALSAAVQ